jgi:hypothetical protein
MVSALMHEVLVAEYVVCSQPTCGCHVGGMIHGPFWRRVRSPGDRWRSRYLHRADARRVARLCGRGRERRLRGGVGHTSDD